MTMMVIAIMITIIKITMKTMILMITMLFKKTTTILIYFGSNEKKA